jgi:hypothetical protein
LEGEEERRGRYRKRMWGGQERRVERKHETEEVKKDRKRSREEKTWKEKSRRNRKELRER